MVDDAVPAKADMLAAARKKLKDFEARQKVDGRSSPASSIISSEPGTGAGLNGRSSVISEDSTALQMPQSSSSVQSFTGRNGVNASPFVPNGNEWYQAYSQLKVQHDELCAHYAQLHSAYSQVNANGVHVDAESQIVQLQNALSAMVEDKVSFQSELRHANEQIENLRQMLSVAEKSLNQMSKTSNSGYNQNTSEEVRRLTESIAQKDNLLTARHQELEGARREVSSVQASLINVQHERSEAQARVKSLIKETSAQEGRIEQLQKDIQMKDLYLKQLGGSSSINGFYQVNNNQDNLLHELESLKVEKVRFLAETATLKSHYADRENALLQKQAEMVVELDKLHTLQFLSSDQIENLEHQLQIALSEIRSFQSKQNVPEYQEEVANITEEDVTKRIREACHVERGKWERKIEEDNRQKEEDILEKDKLIFEREQSLAELEMKYRLLEERTLESTANGADLLSLSEQLQNEKATVSRAVAQNKELKERLLETEDRFVVLTEEKAVVELAKQSAEHQVRELTKQLNLESAGLVGNLAEVIASQSHLEADPKTSQNGEASSSQKQYNDLESMNTELNETLESLKRENAEVRFDLEQKTQELQQVRADLRRSTTHNEQMDGIMRQNAEDENQNSIHVELTQAVGRIQELAAENEQMREVLNDVRQQLEEERSDRRVELEMKKKEEIETEQDLLELKSSQDVESQPSRELHEDLWARKELEKRFARAMMQNADLVEAIDRLEHINQQLELENDTIADHVVLYQHQRKLVRERLRVKDEQLKAMEEERSRTVARCQELQNVLMTVLNKGGVLKEYPTTSLSRRAARRVSRSYSHSTVDELSGDEDVVIDAKMEEVPEREKVHGHGDDEKIIETKTTVMLEAKDRSTPESHVGKEEHMCISDQQQDASVRRILEIISDISRPQPLLTVQLHCTQCIGDLQEL